MNKQKQIDTIMNSFNFKNVHKVMTVLDWTWATTGSVPSVEQLKESANRLLNRLDEKEGTNYIATGGFKASKRKNEFDQNYYELEFIVEESSGEFV